MKLRQEVNENDEKLSRSYIELEENETDIEHLCIESGVLRKGELYIPEGAKVIKKHALYYGGFHTYYFPKSLVKLERSLFSIDSIYRYVRKANIIYPGTSLEFMNIAEIVKEEKCESDGYDHYPYYSGGSRWVTYYHCFDNYTYEIEVQCQGDGVTLLYGTKYREDDEPPKVKEKGE